MFQRKAPKTFSGLLFIKIKAPGGENSPMGQMVLPVKAGLINAPSNRPSAAINGIVGG